MPLKRRGGCGINKMLRSHRSAADGREAQARQREAVIVVSSAKPSGLNNFAELTTPAALFRNGSIFFDCASTPPFQGGEYSLIPIHSHLHTPRLQWHCVRFWHFLA